MKKICSVILAMLMLLAAVSVSADYSEISLQDNMQAQVFDASNGVSLPYRIYVPEGYSPEKQYSFLLFLHGAGNRGDENLSQISENGGLIQRIISGETVTYNGEDVDTSKEFIIIAPQCAKEKQWVDTPWGKSPDPSYSLSDVAKSTYMTALEELVEDIKSEYTINSDRMYITGLSMGGFGTWDFVLRHPDMWAAAIPMGGGGDPELAETIKDVPIWAFHQFYDTVVLSEGTLHMTQALIQAGGNVKLTGYFDPQHNAWTKGYAEADMLSWLYSNTLTQHKEYKPSYKISTASDWAKREAAMMFELGFAPQSMQENLKANATTQELSELLGKVLGVQISLESTTRESLAAALVKALEIDSQESASFADVSAVSADALEAVSALAAGGVINGYADGSFRPADNVTREEALAMIYRTYHLANRPKS